ncbi:MAG: hypothetical protein IPG08_15625 [Sphingobacteriaceae bacterium]|nr:hypothetical protein [Sphingobacteriaceae bacterium]
MKKVVLVIIVLNLQRAAQTSCSNADFEASSAGQITSSNQITGWIVENGVNQFPNNSCNLGGCCPNAPSKSNLISAIATGYIDPVIGAQYPLFSVFGTSINNGFGYNAQLGINSMCGVNFLRLNDQISGDYSIEKASKKIKITSDNSILRYAFVYVGYGSHPCCDGNLFQVGLTNITTNSILTSFFKHSLSSIHFLLFN